MRSKIKLACQFLRKRVAACLIFIILIIVAVVAISLLRHSHGNNTPQNLPAAEDKISRHMLLPKNEKPALLTVVDKSKLESPFLKSKAQNGDIILVYKYNQLAIIYRPSIDRIVGVGTVSIDSPPKS